MSLVTAQFENAEGQILGPILSLPQETSRKQLELALETLLTEFQPPKSSHDLEDDIHTEHVHYTFFVNGLEINDTLSSTLLTANNNNNCTGESSHELVVKIRYVKESLFRVRSATRCSSTLRGHAEAVLSVAFSPNSQYLVSGSGDSRVKWWDLNTETPYSDIAIENPHKSWILALAWSSDGQFLASGGMDALVVVWKASSRAPIKTLKGHSGPIHSLAWQPLHLVSPPNTNISLNDMNAPCSLLASGSKDGTIRIWDIMRGVSLRVLSLHTMAVTCLKWSGENVLYSGSRDRSFRIWKIVSLQKSNTALSTADFGLSEFFLKHAHWINTMALHTEPVLRYGPYDPDEVFKSKSAFENMTLSQAIQKSNQYYISHNSQRIDRVATGSDDATLYLWIFQHSNSTPEKESSNLIKSVRLTGHQGPISDVAFSPKGGQFLLSASFDKSLRLWDGHTGQYLCTFSKAHVASIYRLVWSPDARLFASASKDSTIRIWHVNKRKVINTQSGHLDEIFTLDWSPDGERLASGSKDKTLKIWRP